MDDASMNHYEKQLYTVFKTFDVDNEEALDRSAVNELCNALQLEDRGAALVNSLFERRSDRVTFAQFRNGLLAVLGGASGEHAPAVPAPPEPPPEPDAPPLQSDDDSSGREVAPKFVFGSKKYGRRSRPPRQGSATDDSPSPRSSSASRLDSDDKKARQRMRCRRSASAMESRDENCEVVRSQEEPAHVKNFEHDRRIDREEAFELCRGLNMDGIDQQLIKRIFEDSGTTKTTVGEFFDRLNMSLTTTMEEAAREVQAPTTCDDSGDVTEDEGGGLPAELVLHAWQRAGVQQPRRLLTELGFGAAALRAPDLERALDDELRTLSEPSPEPRDAGALLLVAALALSRLRLELARRRADRATAERDKLRADVAEANRHARVLAQEVDESHARIEAELKASLRRAEARHAETIRQAATEYQAERERAATAHQRLEAELARRSEAEARLRGEASALRAAVHELEGRAAAADQRAADAERERARLAAELQAAADAAQRDRAAAAPDAALQARLDDLRRDNARLRDRVDELCAELEARPPHRNALPQRSGDLSAELDSVLTREQAEECDSTPESIDQTTMSDVDAVTCLREVLDSALESQAQCAACAANVRRLSGATPPSDTAPPRRLHAAAQTDPDARADELQKLTSLVKDLESSLEQMKVEYEKCEEYWSAKLEEERALLCEEQRQGDERLADLVHKIQEYERQFAPPALPTIDERAALEAQVTDLQDEFTRYKRDAEREVRAATARAAAAAQRAQLLERRLATYEARDTRDSREAREAREVRELRGRTARAEAAARRLQARLAAADLLVKDLYVENCHLAHRAPL